jgi:DNA-directed RNA polymerase subunit beta'
MKQDYLMDFDEIQIRLASPEIIKSWSHGEVTKPETINYRTLRPEKDGLFCEKIFGPTKDWECYCGKYKKIRYRGIICDKCGVEVTHSRVRRERMGHIDLVAPVGHVWFFRGAPSKLSILLDLSPRDLEAVVYFASYLVVETDEAAREKTRQRLAKNLRQREEELAKQTKAKITELEAAFRKKKKQIEKSVKDVGQREIQVKEAEYGKRRAIKSLQDEQTIETTRLEEIYKAVETLVKQVKPLSLLTEEEYLKLVEYEAADFFKVEMGAEAVLSALKTLDLSKLAKDLRREISKSRGQKKTRLTRRLRLVERMNRAKINPEWSIIRILPVIPPDLRPMVQLSGGRFATSDLNDLYRRVINRNNRLRRLMDLGAPEIILRNEKRMLQEAVDSLIDSPRRGTSRRQRGRRKELRSLSDMLRGKQGRFRQNLLGKRVDYSGRSVIVVGPELRLDQAGIPKEIALEIYKPFVLRELISRGLAPNVKSAKNVLERHSPEVYEILEDVTRDHPVLLNRAPTLHRLGIQAFYPVLVEGSAIQIHPSVCAGYNADFDGDQMAIHLPLSQEAIRESKELMLSVHNLLRPADGTPMTLPNKEMALGIYYLTKPDPEAANIPTVFSSPDEAVLAYQTNQITLRAPIYVKVGTEEVIETTVGRIFFNQSLPEKLRYINETVKSGRIKALVKEALDQCSEAEVVELIDNLKTVGFYGATVSGVTMAIADCLIIKDKDEIVRKADEKAAKIEENYNQGLIGREEMRSLSHDVWMETTSYIAEKTWDYLGEENPVRMIVESGSRGSRDQVKQMAGMRGLVADPTGRIVDLPIKGNYREGLSVFEYFTSSRGARKGLADKALKTAEAGYLTRRLADVAHDVLVREEDCGTKRGLEIERESERMTAFETRIFGKFTAAAVKKGRKTIVKAGELITAPLAAEIGKAGVASVTVRSPLTCETEYGVCVKCYGLQLASNDLVKIGDPVGTIAAQSIGEPGTQLTMRTFHLGGIVGLDITQGLPRVEELLEARTPKVLAPIAEFDGKVSVAETEQGHVVTVKEVGVKDGEKRSYEIPATYTLKVKEGDLVSAGTPLAGGHLDIKELVRVKGVLGAQRYIVDECQAVYESQGVPIDDKHFETIVRAMSSKVRVTASGDTDLLPGELVEKRRFQQANRELPKGAKKAVAARVILGITKAARYTESFLSAASFQDTTNVLTDAAVEGRVDYLIGLKENVILGRQIPTSPERARRVLEKLN